MKNITLVFAAVNLPDADGMSLRDYAVLIPTALTGPVEGVLECARAMMLGSVAPSPDQHRTTLDLMEAAGVVSDHRFAFIEGRVSLDPGLDAALSVAIGNRVGGDIDLSLIEACKKLLSSVKGDVASTVPVEKI